MEKEHKNSLMVTYMWEVMLTGNLQVMDNTIGPIVVFSRVTLRMDYVTVMVCGKEVQESQTSMRECMPMTRSVDMGYLLGLAVISIKGTISTT